jgi:hypothetical protein
MVETIRSLKYHWMTIPIYVVAVATAITIVVLVCMHGGTDAATYAFGGSVLGGIATGWALFFARGKLQSRYNPNRKYPQRPKKFKGAPSALRLVNWPPDPADPNWLPKFERVEA